jgi:hypothetical protein
VPLIELNIRRIRIDTQRLRSCALHHPVLVIFAIEASGPRIAAVKE